MAGITHNTLDSTGWYSQHIGTYQIYKCLHLVIELQIGQNVGAKRIVEEKHKIPKMPYDNV